MKKVFIILVSLFALMAASTGLKAQEVTILLRPGWNWIGYPYAELIDLENAFVDFEPMNDDVIQSFWGYSEYAAGYGWFGAVDELQPGWGYMYYSNRTEAIIVELSAPATQTTVTTNEPTNITAESAVVGGTVTVPEGTHVFLRGVCWGTEPIPDIDGSHTTEETGIGSFSSTLDGLNPNTTYNVRAYAVTDHGLAYGNELSFTTEAGGSGGDHEYVDLGLPSGLLWATCNVGADNPEDYGDYYAWGETQPKDIYNWSTYQHSNGNSYNKLTKYCNDSYYGFNGFTDTLTILLPEDDAATTNWGSDWRTPTIEDWFELYQNTTRTWATQNGVNGMLFTASNGNSFFLPAAGKCYDSNFIGVGDNGNYWSSSLYTNPCDAHDIFMFETGFGLTGTYRSHGQPVRAVRFSGQSTVPTGAIDGKFTINADGDQVYFSKGNLQYQASTNIWRFAENQWNYVGSSNNQNHPGNVIDSDNCLISETYDGWIDLFCWGTSGWNNGNVYYQPYDYECMDVWNASDYGYGYGPTDGIDYGLSLTDDFANADWGVYNVISNGGNMPNQWRTLTGYQWNYVLNYRSTTSGILFAKAKVNDVCGVILLPDDWVGSVYALNYPNRGDAPYSTNIIDASNWETLENNGAVFLPAAGYRSRNWMGNITDVYGRYWSASAHNSLNPYRYAYYLAFKSDFLDAQFNNYEGYRYYGYSVRLVSDVP